MPSLNNNLKAFWNTRVNAKGDKVRFRTLYGGRMSGKCVKHDTPILMHDRTIKLASELAIGDKLLGMDSKPRVIKDLVYGSDLLYHVKQNGAMDYYVTGNHKLVLHSTEAGYGQDYITIPAKELVEKSAKFRNVFKGFKIAVDDERKQYICNVITVTPDKVGDYVGIEVDQDHMFCLADGTVTHNSHDMAGIAISQANACYRRFVCCRMFQNKIADSVYTLLIDKIDQFGLSEYFTITKDMIKHNITGSEFKFYGVARNIQELKSMEGISVLWFEEAHNLTEEAYNILVPTVMRNANSEMWFTFNPNLVSDFAYQRLVVNPPTGSLMRKINYQENYFLGSDALASIESARLEDEDIFNHIYLGIPLSDDDSSVIKRSWIEASIDAHKHLEIDMSGNLIAGYDIADSGKDRNAVTVFDGSIAVKLDAWKASEDELKQSAIRAYNHIKNNPNALLIYDPVGVGAHVGSTLRAIHARNVHKFQAGGAVKYPDRYYQTNVTNKSHFENLKAQAWQATADRFRNTYNAITKGMQYEPSELISIDSRIDNLEKLKSELALPHKDISKRGLFIVESKKDIKKRLKGMESPDLADSFVMACNPDLSDKKFDLIELADVVADESSYLIDDEEIEEFNSWY